MERRTFGICGTFLIFGACMSASFASENVGTPESELVTRPTVGLVLGGGGARGAAHVGVIKVLDELQIPIDYIAGTSMGAIVGGLYASGMSADELINVIETADWSALLTDRPPRAQRSFRRKSDDIGFLVDFDLGIDKSGLIFPEGFIQGQNLEIALKRLALPAISTDNFDELPIPFRAVATDIVTGEAVVLDSGDLAAAMRASMSAPGIFKPVRRDGRILVDGGVANNLPVQVVRDMGADILIVVDVGFPLLSEEQLGSALAVTRQMLTVLINSRAQDQIALLAADDILISPNLGDFGSQDFQRLTDAQDLGKEKARELSGDLTKLSTTNEKYRAYRKRVERNRHDVPVIDSVVVENESRLSPKVIEARLTEQDGKPLDIGQLESDIANIYGFDTFETVTYDVVNDTGRNTLLVRATEKSWGPNYLRFGVNLEDDFSGNSNYNVAARLTRTEINRLGGEFRAELQIGETPRLFAELYQPLDYASRWFVNPQIEFARSGSGLFDNNGLQIAQIGSDDARLSLDGGRQFGNWGAFRVGVSRVHSDAELRIGMPGFPGGSAQFTSLTADFEYDTIDRVAVPRSGTNLGIEWIGPRESLGSDITVDLASLSFLKPLTWGNNTLLHWWELGSTTKDETAGISPFSLGGLFSLSGYAPDELDGKHVGIGRMLYYYRLGDQTLALFDTPIYVGGSVEAGNVWQTTDAIAWDNTLVAGSVFIVFDSILGPLYIAYGAAEGGRRSAYLFLGQTF
jgi:NTE family protein